MTLNAYHLWLKKREFKAPRLSFTHSLTSSTVSHGSPCLEKLSRDSKLVKGVRNNTFHAKFYTNSAPQIIRKSIAQPLTGTKRPRSSTCSQKNNEIILLKMMKKLNGTNIRGHGDTEANKDAHVVEQQQNGNEDAKYQWIKEKSTSMIVRELTIGSKVLTKKQLTVKKMEAKAESTKPVDGELTCNLARESEAKQLIRGKSCLLQSRKTEKRKIKVRDTLDGTTKRGWFDADTTDGGVISLDGSFYKQDVGKTMQTLHKSDDYMMTIGARYYGGYVEERKKDVECSRLPPNFLMKPKQRDVIISVLNESEYWMAVDRFSHLT